jgi:hypothetical protein
VKPLVSGSAMWAGTTTSLGRWMVHAGPMVTPVAGNILHHAIEMFLKAGLVEYLPTRDLKYNLGHELGKPWREFKAKLADPELDHFDGAIERLDAFEDIRYPDKLVTEGLQLLVSPGSSTGSTGTNRSIFHLAVQR